MALQSREMTRPPLRTSKGPRVINDGPSGIFQDVRAAALGQRPPLAVLAAEVLLGLGRVGELHVLRVPLQPLAGAERDVAEVVGLGQRAGVAEVAVGRLAGLARLDPLL